MTAITAPTWIDVEEILDDLEAGKSRPLFRPRLVPPVPTTALPRRPRLGGLRFLATWLYARVAGRVHPGLARRALWRLWFTPWVGRTPTVELPEDAMGLDRVVAGRQVRGFVLGSGPTVLAVHGWGGSSRDMLPIAEDLAAAGHRVVVPDLPAHGASPGRMVNLFELSAALAELIQVEGPVHAVVAHSLGFPTAVMAIELLQDAGLPHPRNVTAIAPARRMESALERFVDRARLRPALHGELRAMLEEAFGQDIWERLDTAPALTSLAARGVIVHDRDDREIPHEEAEQMAAAWGVDLISTEGLGHRRILADEQVRATVLAQAA
ncbi:MAG: alpha/beta fold hydrolase [Nitriliruptorales bacterium]|nr:alpha/beta fold hydrolase [Nitriliruptorales bacterium]